MRRALPLAAVLALGLGLGAASAQDTTTLLSKFLVNLRAGYLNPSSYVSVGATPATAGAVRLENAAWIYGRNAANSGNIIIIRATAANGVELGPVGSVVLDSAGHVVPAVTNAYDIGLTGTRFRTGYFSTSVVAPLYVAGSTSGVSAGPCLPANITVVGGIVTAMTGGTC